MTTSYYNNDLIFETKAVRSQGHLAAIQRPGHWTDNCESFLMLIISLNAHISLRKLCSFSYILIGTHKNMSLGRLDILH